MDQPKDQSKFIIQRFDTYISSANTKGAFLLAFNTFLCGGVISNYTTLKGLLAPENLILLHICLILLFSCALLATAFVLAAVYPFLNSGNSSKDNYHSHIFFKSVAEYKDDVEFAEAFKHRGDEEVENDMSRQAYYLAKALRSKYNSLSNAIRFVYAELVLLLLTLILISIF